MTTYLNRGSTTTCHTFQRKFSRRYVPLSATAAAAGDPTAGADLGLLGLAEAEAESRRAEIDAQQGAVDPAIKMQLRKLTAHIVKYIEKAHGLTLGGGSGGPTCAGWAGAPGWGGRGSGKTTP